MNQPKKKRILNIPGQFSHFCYTKQMDAYMPIAEVMDISPDNNLTRSARNADREA